MGSRTCLAAHKTRYKRIVIAHASTISIGNVLRTAGSIATALLVCTDISSRERWSQQKNLLSDNPRYGGSQGRPGSAFGVRAHRPRSLLHKPPKSPTASPLTRDNASGTPSLAIGSTNASVAGRITAWWIARHRSFPRSYIK